MASHRPKPSAAATAAPSLAHARRAPGLISAASMMQPGRAVMHVDSNVPSKNALPKVAASPKMATMFISARFQGLRQCPIREEWLLAAGTVLRGRKIQQFLWRRIQAKRVHEYRS